MAKQSLVIVESPAKAKTIGKYLGKDYEVKACMGHLRDLQKSKLSVDVDNDFEPVYKHQGEGSHHSDLKNPPRRRIPCTSQPTRTARARLSAGT